MADGMLRDYETTSLRNFYNRRVLYVNQFLLTLSWSVERTALVVYSLNDSGDGTIGVVAFAIIRIIWEAALVLGGWLVGLLVIWFGFKRAVLV